MQSFLKILLCAMLLTGEAMANAAPVIELGTPGNYCVVYCYVRVPFSIANYGTTNKIGRVFCDFDVEVSAKLPVYNGETRARKIQVSSIGVFKSVAGITTGDAEMSTGIIKQYFVGAKVKSINCHL